MQQQDDTQQAAELRLAFLRHLPSHLVLDDGRLVVAHAGLPEALHGQESPAIRHLASWGRPGAGRGGRRPGLRGGK